MGREQSQWIVKQVLDIGVYGIVFPMINTPEDAVAALQAARYIQAEDAPDQEPVGRRGHAPGNALRYWGLDQPEYFDRADVWPLESGRGDPADPAVRDDRGRGQPPRDPRRGAEAGG